MTYPIERIINRFLQNPHGVLSKTFIEILTDFYGDALARVTFIHALTHFVNCGITDVMHSLAGQHGTYPYAVVCPEGINRIQNDISSFAAVQATRTQLYPFPGVERSWIDTGVLLGLPQYNDSVDRVWASFYKDNLQVMLESQCLSWASSITTRYYDRTYDLLLKDDYTDTPALITALNSDPLFSSDNRRNWV